MVKRIYVEKKPSFANESSYLLSELRDLLGIKQLTALRMTSKVLKTSCLPWLCVLFFQSRRSMIHMPL